MTLVTHAHGPQQDLRLRQQLIVGVTSRDISAGAFSLPPRPIALKEASGGDQSRPSLLKALRDARTIPSLAWAYTAGSYYAELPAFASLVLGGYDASRFVPNGVSFDMGINVADELEGYNETRATKRVARIHDSVKKIIAIAKRDGVPNNVAADTLALERLDAISSIERLHTGHPYGQERRRRETL